MKRLILFLLVLVPLLALSVPVKAQTVRTDSTEMVAVTPYVYSVYTAGIIKGTDTAYSKKFTRYDFDSTYSFYAKLANIRDSAKVTVKLQDSPDGTTWRDLRTLISAATVRDSMYYKEDVFTEIPRYYRYIIYGTTGNGYSTYYYTWLFTRRE